jgi:hypothetical protein
MMSTGGSYKCEECDMSFNSERELKEHDKYAKYRRKVIVGNDDAKNKKRKSCNKPDIPIIEF